MFGLPAAAGRPSWCLRHLPPAVPSFCVVVARVCQSQAFSGEFVSSSLTFDRLTMIIYHQQPTHGVPDPPEPPMPTSPARAKYTRPPVRHGSGPSRADAPKYGRFHASSRWTSCIVQLPASPASIRSNSRLGLRLWQACDGVQGGVSESACGAGGAGCGAPSMDAWLMLTFAVNSIAPEAAPRHVAVVGPYLP